MSPDSRDAVYCPRKFTPLLGGLLANAFNPGVPFLAYAPLLVLSAVLLAVVGRETLET